MTCQNGLFFDCEAGCFGFSPGRDALLELPLVLLIQRCDPCSFCLTFSLCLGQFTFHHQGDNFGRAAFLVAFQCPGAFLSADIGPRFGDQ